MGTFKRVVVPRTLNFLLLCGSAFMLGTGLALVYRLPPRVRGGGGLTMLGMDRHQWGDLHFYTGVALGILVVVHVLLHWGWVKRAAGALRFRLGWILLLLGLAIVAVPLVLPVS